MRWGIRSDVGTVKGNCRKEGNKTVSRGTESDRLDWLLLSSVQTSFVVSIIAVAIRKVVHSKIILIGPIIEVPMPYHVCVIGQSSCMPPPVKKSPIRMCCINAAK
jgi:hypothetical protein